MSSAPSERDIEYPLLRVPYESLNKIFRQSQKAIEKDIGVLEKAVKSAAGTKKQVSKEDACKFLDKIVTKLVGVKRKLEEIDVLEVEQLNIIRQRLEHLESAPKNVVGETFATTESLTTKSMKPQRWNRIRLDRILVDYLLRQGYFEAAVQLAESSNIKELVDIDIFIKSRDVVDSLKAHDCEKALTWCSENKSRLKKLKSSFEFNLRLQQFIELVRKDKKQDAIQHARTHLTTLAQESEDAQQADQMLAQIRQAMATLAFGKNTSLPPYKDLFSVSKWDKLVEEFKLNNFMLYCLTTKPLLYITLQAGLSALKTPQAYQESHFNVNDPLCHAHFQQLADDLPFAVHVHSKLVCRVTGRLMDYENPPMVLPNGNVYSLEACRAMAAKSTDKQSVKDPRTGDVFKMDQLKKGVIIS